MLLTIRQTGPGAGNLPALLHHSHDAIHPISFATGKAKVFYPEYESNLVEAALLLEADPLLRADPELPFLAAGPPIAQYVNPRPYLCSGLMVLAMEAAFPNALEGKCSENPEAVDQNRKLAIELTAVPFSGEEAQLRSVLRLSGYEIEIEPIVADAVSDLRVANAGACHIRLTGESTLSQLLRRLYAILALLDQEKDFWLGAETVDGIWQRIQPWFSEDELADLEGDFFASRMKLHNPTLKRLGQVEDPTERSDASDEFEKQLEDSIELQSKREKVIFESLKRAGARSILDLNANSHGFIEKLLRDGQFTSVSASNIAIIPLQKVVNFLNQSGLSPEEVAKLQVFPGSPMYRDERTQGHDAVVLAEWIEHLPPSRLPSLEMSVFRYMKPQLVLVTTPNAEYNPLFEQLPLDRKRNALHHFEWTRAEFKTWAEKVAEEYNYRMRIVHIGEKHPQLGTPSQMAHFTKIES